MDERQSAAWMLYRNGYTLKSIAAIMQVTERALQTWKQKFDWDKRLVEEQTAIQNIEKDIVACVQYQLSVMNTVVEANKESGNKKPIDKGEIDAVVKLMSGMKIFVKAPNWEVHVKIMKSFLEFAKTQKDCDVKQLAILTQNFLKEKKLMLSDE